MRRIRLHLLICLAFLPAMSWAAPTDVQIVGSTTVPVEIQGTPSVNATIQGTPNVNATISGVPNVNATIQGTPNVSVTNPITVNSAPSFASLDDAVSDHSQNEIIVWACCGVLFGLGFLGGNKL